MLKRRISILLVFGMAAASVSYAATTGRMAGNVVDNEGLALPGVTVSISSDQLIGGPQISITDADGGFVFNILPVGIYRVEANLAGFQPAVAEVRVALDRVANVTFNMVPEQFGGEIEVVAEVPVVDTTQVNTSVVFDQDFLQKAAVGSGGRDYLQVIGQAAGVAGTGNASVFGSTDSDNSYLIDGLNTSDPSLGTFGTNFNYDAIQEVSFQTGGFEAEFGQATGGIINLVTKSGGNEFSGSFDVRYRDESFIENGDHFDRDTQTSELRNIAATLGGPIVRDKLWFFASLENVFTSAQDEGATFPREFEGWNYIAKGTWQVSNSNRLVFKYSGDPAEIPGRNMGEDVMATGALTTKQGGDHYQVELNSVLSESVLLNASIGRADMYTEGAPSHGNLDRSGHFNEDTTETWVYQWAWDLPRGRDQFNLATTFFVDEFAGSHEFKTGAEYTDLWEEDSTFLTGGGNFDDMEPIVGRDFEDLNGDGFYNHFVTIKEPEDTAREPLDSTGETLSFYVQDAWRPVANLTIKPGVRFDNVKTVNHVGDKIADMDQWQPRLGVAWDLMGDAKHVVRGSWGRFMDPTALSIAGFARGVDTRYHEYNTYEFYCNSIGLCDMALLEMIYGDAIMWTNGEGYTYTLFDARDTDVFDPAETVDQAGFGTLKAPYAETMILAYEAQIFAETSIEFTYVDKVTEEMIEDTCVDNTWAWGDGDYPDIDDTDTWTRAEDCTQYIVANMPTFERRYKGYILKFETRRENFHLMSSITKSKSEGNTANGADDTYATELADFYPLHFYNREGYLPDHRDYRVKLSGYWLLPYDFSLGFDGFYSSPGHISPSALCSSYVDAGSNLLDYYGYDESMEAYCFSGDGADLSSGTDDIYLEPRGSFETKSTWQLDMQVSKAFHVGSVDMTAVVAIYNIFDREDDRTFNSTAFRVTDEERGDPVDIGTPTNPSTEYYMPIGAPTSYRQPRRYELGFRIEF